MVTEVKFNKSFIIVLRYMLFYVHQQEIEKPDKHTRVFRVRFLSLVISFEIITNINKFSF